ncbi:hypothetical protein PSTG_02221 [Puccinia striiformis f. sp. tritici PST-78]|uniref:Protein ZIP4 homolog n=1 Tax=Puccinia striiformis f. sp. tritici PST-78 TaxID=1165861 RepID=A0A0L0W0C4_9BASI|nr:hypothetical protein PSTG_02221 [Puccinia striiformis f. sp. tritici PST-78]
MAISDNSQQLSKTRDAHSRLISLLENSRHQIIAYSPSETRPASLEDQQLEHQLSSELTKLISLANDFAGSFRKVQDIRPALSKHPIDLALSIDREEYERWADEMDARGVELWNRASQLRRVLDNQRSSIPDYIEPDKLYHSALRTLHQRNSTLSRLPLKSRVREEPSLSERIWAKMRQLGYIMIYTGSPVKKDITMLLKLIGITSKASKAQLIVYDLESAMKNIETALESWASGNETGTLFNLRKALAYFPQTSNDQTQPVDSLQVIIRLYKFSYELLKPTSTTNQISERTESRDDTNNLEKLPVLIKASEWLTLALNELDSHSWPSLVSEALMADHQRMDEIHGSTSELKVKIIRALAYSFLEAASIETGDQRDELQRKGEQALEEALINCPSQALWLRKIQILTKRKIMGSELRTAVKEVLKTAPFNQELINKLMAVSHNLPEDRQVFFSKILNACVIKEDPIERGLGDPAYYSIVAYSVSSQKSTNKKRNQSKSSARDSFTNLPSHDLSDESKFQFLKDTADQAILANSEFRLGSDCAFMSQTMIWHRGDQEYKKMRFDSAAKWYTFGTHAIFLETKEVTFTKLARKAALSWVNHGNYELARNSLRNLTPQGYNEAGTHFLSFMIDSAQGNELPAIQAIDRLINSLDFKPETLLYAAQQANSRGLQNLLHHILQKTLESTSGANGAHFINGLDMVILLRSLIRIDLSNLAVPHRNRANDEQRILQHYKAAKEMLIQSQEARAIQVSFKDATWLWKTAFNTCVSATEDWPEDLVFEFFGLTADLISLTRKIPTSLEEAQALTRHEIHCRFACLAGGMTQALYGDRDDYHRNNLEQPLLTSIKQLKRLSKDAQDIGSSSDLNFIEKLNKIRSCLTVWEFEIYSMGNDWEAIRFFMKELEINQESQAFISTQVTQSIAEVACQDASLPTELLIFVLEHVMMIADRQREKSIDSRSRWLRLLIDLELSINSDEGALRYSNQALQLLQRYPVS